MRKMIHKGVLALVVAAGVFGGSLAFAEDSDMPQEQMGGPGKGKMMGMMHKDSLVATSDGGVIVLSGPRLLKYDKDLNLVKEVEMPKGKKPERNEQD